MKDNLRMRNDMSVELTDLDLSGVLAPDDAAPPYAEPTVVEPEEPDEPVNTRSSEAADLTTTTTSDNRTACDARTAFYTSLPTADAEKLRAAAERMITLTARTMLEIGRELITISEELPGHFEIWLRLEFGMSRATAYNYMNAARHFTSEPDVVAALPAKTVYKLASTTTPDEVRDSVVRQIATGDLISSEAVEELIAEAKAKVAGEKRGKAKGRKPKHPPAANDDIKTLNQELTANTGDPVATERPAGESVGTLVEPVVVASAAGKTVGSDSSNQQGLADEIAHEAFASLRMHPTSNTFERLVTCARSEAAWNSLRGMLTTHSATNVAA
jgi:hypothetical protein